MLLYRLNSIVNKVYNYARLKKCHVYYKDFPAINGKIKISHDRYSEAASKYPKIKMGKGIFINSGPNMNLIGRGEVTIVRTIDTGEIVIGDNLRMSNATIVSKKKITIGNDVMIGGGVTIWDTDFHSLNCHTRIYNPFDDIASKEIIISDGVFIGSGSYILKGVTIGKNSVVGAGSVVACDIPENEIWAGNPARFVRRLT